MTKKVKDILKSIPGEDALTISETIDMINDELMGAELKKKVVRNGLKLLRIILEKLENEDISEPVLVYCDYVEEVAIEK